MKKVLSLLDQFQSFLRPLPSASLNGWISLRLPQFQKYPPLTLQQAHNIASILILKEVASERKRNWTFDEVSLLLYLIDKTCLKLNTDVDNFEDGDWEKIAYFLPGHLYKSCRLKYFSLMPVKVTKKPWNEKEEQILNLLIEQKGMDWKVIEEELWERNQFKTFRTAKQCREHYNCFLQPNLKKGFWTNKEDFLLCSSFLKHNGKIWSHISAEIDGRNQNSVKNRFYLLFESKTNRNKLYHSELIRRVKKKKARLERLLAQDQNLSEKKQSKQINSLKLIEDNYFQNSQQFFGEQIISQDKNSPLNIKSFFNISDFLSLE